MYQSVISQDWNLVRESLNSEFKVCLSDSNIREHIFLDNTLLQFKFLHGFIDIEVLYHHEIRTKLEFLKTKLLL